MKKSVTLLLAAFIVAALAGVAPAADSSFFRLLSPRFGNMEVEGSYSGRVWGESDVKDSDLDFGMQKHDFAFQAPLYQDQRNELAIGISADVRIVDTDLILPEVNRKFPDDLWDLNLGLSYRRKINQKWVGGVRAAIGSPSDKPFHTWDEVAYNGAAFARYDINKNHGMYFFLFYSSITDFLPGIPFPGVGWLYNNDDRSLSVMLGAPLLFVNWRPVKQLSLKVIYFPVRNVYAEASWSFNKSLRAYACYSWSYQDYYLSDRPREENRLFYYEMRGMGGLEYKATENVTLGLSGGYAFERMMFQGENYGDDDQYRIDLDPTWLVQLNATLHF